MKIKLTTHEFYHINAKEDQISFSFGVYDGEECKAVKRNMVSESCQKLSIEYLIPPG